MIQATRIQHVIKIIYVADKKMLNSIHKKFGFTLFETLLVLGIMSAFLIMSIQFVTQRAIETKIDKAAIQYQQILNAELAYSINNSQWATIPGLTGGGTYLPSTLVNNPWGQPYYVYTDTVTGIFTATKPVVYVYSQVPTTTIEEVGEANRLAGKLPLAIASSSTFSPDAAHPCAKGVACWVTAAVSIPGQNLNNARSVNFANLYHPGACVPAPTCPGNMQPQIMVIPVSVSGVYTDKQLYPINSFTAYAVPSTGPVLGTMSPPSCVADNTFVPCHPQGNFPSSNSYWRICLKIVTEAGDVGTNNPSYGKDVTILAITRCVPLNEPVGSTFIIYETPNGL